MEDILYEKEIQELDDHIEIDEDADIAFIFGSTSLSWCNCKNFYVVDW